MLFLVVRVDDIDIWGRESVRHIVNKANVRALTTTALLQLAYLASEHSLHHSWSHLQLWVPALLDAGPLICGVVEGVHACECVWGPVCVCACMCVSAIYVCARVNACV